MNGVRLVRGHSASVLHLFRASEAPTRRVGPDDRNGPWRRVDLRGLDEAEGVILCAFDQVRELRGLLAFDYNHLFRMTDAQVLRQVVNMLACGELALFEKMPAAVATNQRLQSPMASVALREGIAVTPSTMRRSNESGAPSTTPAPATDRQPFSPSDQNAQAATLRLAAKEGAPFCAVCDKLGQGIAARATRAHDRGLAP
jgi:hypothetical protein